MSITASSINAILVHEDIEGLIEVGAPIDEYESEAAQIAAAILQLEKDQRSEENILAIISLLWMKSFDISAEDITLREPGFKRVARAILATDTVMPA
jgi:hypothetical protein